jgi:hypothetical protein
MRGFAAWHMTAREHVADVAQVFEREAALDCVRGQRRKRHTRMRASSARSVAQE